MGREVRRVPADWQHPKDERTGHFIPLFDGSFRQVLDEWNEENAKWSRGEFPDYADDEDKKMSYSEWSGDQPKSRDYMPDWPDEQRTHLMMYETTSEGTPISPAFKTPEELARWLVDNNASAFGSSAGSYEGWLRVARGGWAPSMVVTDGVVMSKKLKNLDEYNAQQNNLHRKLNSNEPQLNGIACPKCGAELYDSNPMMTLTSMPPKKNVHCIKCDYVGYRTA